MQGRYEYETIRSKNPPSAETLSRLAGEGWRLVSVTVDIDDVVGSSEYVAYLERPSALAMPVANVNKPRLHKARQERQRQLERVVEVA